MYIIIASLSIHVAGPASVPCRPIEPAAIESSVSSVLASSDWHEESEEIYSLQDRWLAHCPESRREASRPVVTALARLLRRPGSRLAAASMLVEVGPNLRYVRRDVRAALADQQRLDRRNARSAVGLLPADQGVVAMSLRCLLSKIRTGQRDAVLCSPVTWDD